MKSKSGKTSKLQSLRANDCYQWLFFTSDYPSYCSRIQPKSNKTNPKCLRFGLIDLLEKTQTHFLWEFSITPCFTCTLTWEYGILNPVLNTASP